MQRAGREHSEFTTMKKSLDAIFEAVEWRIDGLKGTHSFHKLRGIYRHLNISNVPDELTRR
jgi:hypothetical protein